MTARTIITGASGGMGAAAVEALSAQGIPVLMACRNLEKAGTVRHCILGKNPSADIEIRFLDLASLSSVRAFAASLAAGEVSALFNNAGVISRGYHLTGDGLENTFSVNYFGPWLLTRLLLPKLPDDARIVNMVSLTCGMVPFHSVSLRPEKKDFSQLGTYARSKRALLSFSMELARRYPALHVNMADPGIVGSDMIDLGRWFDPLTDKLFKPLCKTPQAGVRPALRALSSAEGNRYFVGRGDRAVPRRYLDPEADGRLWTATTEILSFSD